MSAYIKKIIITCLMLSAFIVKNAYAQGMAGQMGLLETMLNSATKRDSPIALMQPTINASVVPITPIASQTMILNSVVGRTSLPAIGMSNAGVPGIGISTQGVPGMNNILGGGVMMTTQGAPAIGMVTQGNPGIGMITKSVPGIGMVMQGNPGIGIITQGNPGIGMTTKNVPGIGMVMQSISGMSPSMLGGVMTPIIGAGPMPAINFGPLPTMNFDPTPMMLMQGFPANLALWQPMPRRVIFEGSVISGIRSGGRPNIVKYYLDTYTGKQICGYWQGLELPASDYNWWYGCSPTSAGMLMGYYDIYGYNGIVYDLILGGVAEASSYYFNSSYPIDIPLDPPNLSVGPTLLCNKAIASIEHLTDFWASYGSVGDPLVLGRTSVQFNCLADFMGTSQDNLTSAGEGNPDGQTFFYFWTDGSRMTDIDIFNLGYDVYNYSGTYGMVEYTQYCGYRASAFNQYILGYQGNTLGFTYADYVSEIDAGRPVIIHLLGHTMVGIGYDLTTESVIVHDTWNNSAVAGPLTMIWGGTYQMPDGTLLQHHAVTCFTPL